MKWFFFWVLMAGVCVGELALIHHSFKDAGKNSKPCDIFINSLECESALAKR